MTLLLGCIFLNQTYAQSIKGLAINNGQTFFDKDIEMGVKEKNAKVHVDKKGRFRIDLSSDNYSHARFIEYQIDESQDYSIETVVEQVDANDTKAYGIMVGATGWDDALFFIITGNQYYKVYRKVNGLIIYETEWEKCGRINFGDSANSLKVWKHGQKLLFAINGKVFHTMDAFRLSGSYHGFYVGGKGEFGLDNFIIKEFPTENLTTNSNQKQRTDNASENDLQQLQIVGSGTGFIIDKRGYLATNRHVVEGAGAIGICLRIDGEWKSFDGVVIKDDPTNDLAILKIEDPDFKEFSHLPYAFSFDTEDIASEIFTLGYPQVQVMGTDVKYTTGVINARTGFQGDPTHYQISAHIYHGNSGGPLFNEKGYIIGITDSGLNKAEFGDVNYAIKSTYLKILADALPKNLEFANDKSIAEKKRTEQIKILSEYVALILIAK